GLNRASNEVACFSSIRVTSSTVAAAASRVSIRGREDVDRLASVVAIAIVSTLVAIVSATTMSSRPNEVQDANHDERQLNDARRLESEGDYGEALKSYRQLTARTNTELQVAPRAGIVRTAVLSGDFELAYAESRRFDLAESGDSEALSAVAD